MEAEYVALSHSLRQVLHLRRIVKEIGTELGFQKELIVRTHSEIFEDNNGALELANSPHLTPRSRHYSTKLHHFKSHVADGSIVIKRISTKEQRADIQTKPLPRETFERLRKTLTGW
jgi:hypothetical protein